MDNQSQLNLGGSRDGPGSTQGPDSTPVDLTPPYTSRVGIEMSNNPFVAGTKADDPGTINFRVAPLGGHSNHFRKTLRLKKRKN